MNGNNGSDDAGAISVLIAFAALIFLLYHFSDRILGIWQWLIVPVSQVWGWLATTEIGQQLMPLFKRDPATVHKIPEYLASLQPAQLKAMGYVEAKRYGDYVHRFTTLIFSPILIYAGYRCFKHSRMQDPQMFRVVVGIPSIVQLIKQMPGREWMNDVVDASKMDLFGGKIALQAPLTPWRMAEIYNLCEVDDKKQLVRFETEKAAAVFNLTLGPLFTTIEALEKGKYGRAWNTLIKQIPPQDREKAAIAATKGHLYEKTVIIGLIRMMGRLMIVEFGPLSFLRYQDVAFFDAVCSCGRRTSFVAGSGIMGQFRHEVEIYNTSKGTMKPELDAGGRWAAAWLEEALRKDPYERPWVESDDIWASFDPWL
ncbi:hypothetical protein LN429_15520 [Pseudomonas syringae]|uniref:hypothetical protein n=1 Tax=Pseudomonas syringae TaxID=317 RepID=UPI00234D40BE|nr:hypothetical protein [Pseudomonas syringae]MDC6536513.1 hypothetical protein [Pseudomonas syringae]